MQPTYVVTDIEADGPNPGKNSMLSFASVAITQEGQELDTFEAVLAPLLDAVTDAGTIAWFERHPEAYAAATENPRSAEMVINEFVACVLALPGRPVFAAHPIAFDGIWINYYLRRFAGRKLTQAPRDDSPLFYSSGICIRSLASAYLGWPIWECFPGRYPAEWLGNNDHSHRAIDDARGYGNLLAKLLAELKGGNSL